MQESGEWGEGGGQGRPITPTQDTVSTSELHQLGALGNITGETRKVKSEPSHLFLTNLPSLTNCVCGKRSLSEYMTAG
jgi:hypothetical protein